MRSIKIGKFKIELQKEGDIFKVSMSPGRLTVTTTKGETIHNKSDIYFDHDLGYANFHFDQFMQYAGNETTVTLWQRLNRKPLAVYLRFQRFIARHNSGKWVRGVTISNGTCKLNYE